LSEPTIDAILQAAERLYEQGDAGFSITDSAAVGSILKTKQKQSRQVFSLWTILKPYREKLSAIGVEYQALVPPDPFIKATVESKVTIGPSISLKRIETKNGPMVAISFPYNPDLVEIIKKLKSRSWDKESKNWLIPITPVDIEIAMATFKAQSCVLDVDPELRALVEKGKASYVESRAHTSELVIPTKLDLYPFQRAGVKWIDDHDGRALVADEMGCVDGEAEVLVQRTRITRRFKLHELYTRWKRWDKKHVTRVRALVDGELHQHEIVDVLDKGIKPVVEISLASGKKLRVTPDHEICVGVGKFCEAVKLRAGDIVLTNGGDVRFIPTEDKVVSVVPAGERHVYDVVCKDPHRTFVANGVIVHNCGKTPEALGYLVLRPEKALPALVLCPSLIRVTWYRAISKFTDLRPLLVVGKTSLPSFKKAGLDVSLTPLAGYDITITNYDLLAVETPRTWLRNLLSPKKDLESYGEKHLAWAGLQAQELLENAMKKYKDIDSLNRINRVLDQIKDQGARARKIRDPEYKIVLINGVAFEEFVKAGYKTLIVDESHFVKEISSQRTVAAIEISGVVQNAICLTGTPIDNRPKELWSQIQIVNKSVAPKFFDFGMRYCGAFQKPAAAGKMVWDFSGVSNIAELDKLLRTTIMIRRTKEQVLKELPPKTRTMIPFVVEDSQDKIYRKEEASAMDRLREIRKEREEWKALLDALPEADRKSYVAKHAEKAARQAGLKDMAIGEIEKLKEAAVNAKFDECIEFTAGLQETQGKVLVFAVHHKTIDRIVAAFQARGIKTDYVDGRVTGMARQSVMDKFQDGDLEIMVCGIRAVSIGANLVACHTVSFIELDWTPGIHSQAEDRAHRIGQLKAVSVYYLLLLGSIEEKIAKMIDSKREVVNSILGEGDRTIQEAGILDAVMDELLDGNSSG